MAMEGDMSDADFARWSEGQADALRRLRAAERAHDIHWDHLMEEVEGWRTKLVRSGRHDVSPNTSRR